MKRKYRRQRRKQTASQANLQNLLYSEHSVEVKGGSQRKKGQRERRQYYKRQQEKEEEKETRVESGGVSCERDRKMRERVHLL